MSILDKLRRKKKVGLDEPRLPSSMPATRVAHPAPVAPAIPTPIASSSTKAQMDLIMSQLENLRMQYEAISSRLQNIERLVTEIRSFCK